MTFFLQILRNLQAMLVAHFWPIWITSTAVAAICVAWAVGRAAPSGRSQSERNVIPTWRQVGTAADVAALALLAAFLVSYITMTLVWEDFAYWDNEVFSLGTLKGHDIAPPIWPTDGRFWPLGLQEFNLIRHYTDTISGYHVLSIVQLLIFVCILLVLDDELSIAARVVLAILALLTPSILRSFSELIYPERDELFFLACLLLFVKRFQRTESTAWAVAAAVCAQIMLYYKETASLLLLGFAAGRLILRCRSGYHARWNYDRLWDKEGRLDLSFAGLAVLFLLYYFAAMGLHPNMGYAVELRSSFLGRLVFYLRHDLLAWLLVVVVLGRIYLILRDRAASLPMWDGLALGGVVCFLAYLYIGIVSQWYLAPVDLIAVLYVGRFAVLSLEGIRPWRRAAVLIVVFIVVGQDVFFSAGFVFDEKNFIHARVEIARVIKVQYSSRAGTSLRLFFPFASPYSIMEFASYLSYRGMPMEGAEGEGAGLNDVVLAGRAVGEDGPCVGYMTLRCHAASRPAPGDLVIVLPEDEASSAEASAYRAGGEPLFSYEPRPRVSQWLHSLVAGLVGYLPGKSSASREHNKLPDRWMDASVTIWE
jgi:hypothetical protein